ncbi:prepilin-type N-terminal cleavage/methylation domain-containing protein [uncultured Deefgea sp.]|uniref:prepilin-type N-terminal cleavage/methylation domain-containing protein n=1 Tax=uncultured Deefgea sp. TaxID=1304914 RepID=UPI00259759DD|nr:prepilin-type N-terminal cleavage/methylation domain-containing protein [uncultured Deefgea sp.]
MKILKNKTHDGFSLIEVLVSVLILSIGLLSLAGFNGNLYKNVKYSSDRAKAISSAQILIDKARAEDISLLATGADPGSCADNTPHRIWTISNVAGLPNVKNMAIYVCWTDANNVKQEMSLATQIGITTIATTATPAPTPAPTATPTAAPCSTSKGNYIANATYANGDTVKNLGRKYSCKVAGWCSLNGGGWAYAPGTGTAWQQAWNDEGICE